MQRLTAIVIWATITIAAVAQESVTYRDRGGPIQTVKGKIESDTLSGIKIAGKTIPAGDVIEVQYETPGSIKLDLPKAVQAEAAGKWAEAAREYRALSTVPAVVNNKSLKRFFDYKVAWFTAAKSETSPEALRESIEALSQFTKANPDGWERVPVDRLLARLHLDLRPPNYEAARKVYDELAQAAGIPTDLKLDCGFMVVDLLMTQQKKENARKALATLPQSDPRVAVYLIGLEAKPEAIETNAKKLEAMLETAENKTKATIYNLLGDCYRLDPKRRKDALFAYLWVDVVYNQDPMETIKAQERLAELFRDMKDDDRAQHYRKKARGR